MVFRGAWASCVHSESSFYRGTFDEQKRWNNLNECFVLRAESHGQAGMECGFPVVVSK